MSQKDKDFHKQIILARMDEKFNSIGRERLLGYLAYTIMDIEIPAYRNCPGCNCYEQVIKKLQEKIIKCL